MDYSTLSFQELPKYIWLGREHKDWYKDCTSMFIELFGKDELELVCKLFAATSINTSMKANITLFRKAYIELKENKPIGNYLPNIQNQLRLVREGKPLSGRKINSFSQAMSGDSNAVVVDVWMGRIFGVDKKYFRQKSQRMQSGGLTDKNYTLIESYIREQAPQMGLTPCELQSILWAGARIFHNGEVDNTYENLLRFKFHNLFGMI